MYRELVTQAWSVVSTQAVVVNVMTENRPRWGPCSCSVMLWHWQGSFMKCDENGGRNLGSICNSQPHYYVLQTGVLKKIIWRKTEHIGSGRGAPLASQPLPLSCVLCHRAMRGLEPYDITLWGGFPVVPPGQGMAQLLCCTHVQQGWERWPSLSILLLLLKPTWHLLFHRLPSSKWLYITLRFVSLPDLISIRQQLFSAPAICSTLALYSGRAV